MTGLALLASDVKTFARIKNDHGGFVCIACFISLLFFVCTAFLSRKVAVFIDDTKGFRGFSSEWI